MTPGTLIDGKYRLSRLLGEGSMGAVWAAVNERTEKEVALKLLVGSNADHRRRLLREARACGRLSHRNIVEIYDVGETDEGEPFLVMQLLRGETLEARLTREGRLPPPEAVAILGEVAQALIAAHAAGVIHRDLKPANIFLHRDEGAPRPRVIVLDFGVSKMAVDDDPVQTMTGNLVGSPAYMSPEQARARGVDHRTDIWSAGVVLFEAIAGRRPFQAPSAVSVIAEILTSPPPALEAIVPDIDPRLAEIVTRCLVRHPVSRVASAAELASLLASLATPDPTSDAATRERTSTAAAAPADPLTSGARTGTGTLLHDPRAEAARPGTGTLLHDPRAKVAPDDDDGKRTLLRMPNAPARPASDPALRSVADDESFDGTLPIHPAVHAAPLAAGPAKAPIKASPTPTLPLAAVAALRAPNAPALPFAASSADDAAGAAHPSAPDPSAPLAPRPPAGSARRPLLAASLVIVAIALVLLGVRTWRSASNERPHDPTTNQTR